MRNGIDDMDWGRPVARQRSRHVSAPILEPADAVVLVAASRFTAAPFQDETQYTRGEWL